MAKKQIVNNPCKYILIDGDDTLWEENILFRKVVSSTAELLSSIIQLPTKEILSILIKELESDNSPLIASNACGVDVFIDTLLSIANKISTNSPTIKVKNELEKQRLFLKTYPIQLKKGVKDTLPRLADKYECIFYSQGSYEAQSTKLRNSGLEKFFRDVFITPHKNKYNLLNYLTTKEIIPNKAMVVGNSPRSDINPACELGIKAIYLENHVTWRR
ncbi:MAG: hypothetical protein EPO11_06260, partial [Gammaproteobacteria bacterium]